MPEPTWLFYDLETSGLNKCFDQVLQFAAIRTDAKFNILDRQELHVRLNCDTVPSPKAMVTHRIPLEFLKSGQKEIEAIAFIHEVLNTPHTCSLGYNTLGFDDEFLRFSFFRNLLPPYTHQYANGCSRADIYPILILFYLFKPEVLQWPIRNNRISLKLEDLNSTNQLASGQAHQAMVDVEVCLALTKILIKQEKMWNYVTSFFNKKIDLQRMQNLDSVFKTSHHTFQQGLLISPKLGYELNFHAPVISLGQHQHYKNQSLWLRLDLEDLKNTTPDSIEKTTYVVRKRAGEAPFLLPVKEQYLFHLTPERKKLAQENLVWLTERPQLLQQICDYHQHYKYPKVPYLDADAALYEMSFATPVEEQLFKSFHTATPVDKSKIAKNIASTIRQKQVLRILGRHYPEVLSAEQQEIFKSYLNEIMDHSSNSLPQDYRGKTRLTPYQAIQTIAELKSDPILDMEQRRILDELAVYLQDQFRLD